MEFKKMQKALVQNIFKYSEKYGIKIDDEFAEVKLFEEVGEFAQAVLIYKKKSRPGKYVSEKVSKEEIAKELADIVGMAIFNAHFFGIDLEKTIKEKWIDRK